MCRKESIVIVSAIVEVRLSVEAVAMPRSFIWFIGSTVNVLRDSLKLVLICFIPIPNA